MNTLAFFAAVAVAAAPLVSVIIILRKRKAQKPVRSARYLDSTMQVVADPKAKTIVIGRRMK